MMIMAAILMGLGIVILMLMLIVILIPTAVTRALRHY